MCLALAETCVVIASALVSEKSIGTALGPQKIPLSDENSFSDISQSRMPIQLAN